MLIVHGCAVILFAILGIVFFCGKGSSLIAGYNTASPEEKAKYDEKALCHTMGGMMFACAACFGVLMVSDILKSLALMWVGIVLHRDRRRCDLHEHLEQSEEEVNP